MHNNKLQEQLIKLKLDKQVSYYVKLADFSDENVLLDNIASKVFTQQCIIILDGTDTEDSYFADIAKKIKQLCSQFFATLIIKQRADMVLLTEADGILLDKNSLTPHDVLGLLSENTIIGMSENSDDEHVKFCIISQKIKSNFVNKDINVIELKSNG